MNLIAAVATFAAAALLALAGVTPPQTAEESATNQILNPQPINPETRPGEFAFEGELTQGGWIRGIAPSGTQAVTIDGHELTLAEDRTFFAAFDRDSGTAATLAATFRDGKQLRQELTITPRAWNLEHVNVAMRPSIPNEAFLQLRRPELERIAAARAIHSDAQGWRQKFIWPVRGRISGRFGSQRIYRGEAGTYHSGLDLSTGESGTLFVAPADGVVVLAAADKPFTLEGHLLIIDHGNGLNSAFLHCSQLLVKEGDKVTQGQPIGRIGMSGRATGPHLHWSMKWLDARVDPLLFTGPM